MTPYTDTPAKVVEHVNVWKPVQVYWNVHTKCFSVRQQFVRCHATEVVLRDAEFVVNEKGRQRVLREKRKNVHAFVKGFVEPCRSQFTEEAHDLATYNPYKHTSFVLYSTGEPVTHMDEVVLSSFTGAPSIFLYHCAKEITL